MVERYERVKLTNPDKVLYPATGTTKSEVFEYYVAIADAMVPHIAGRPVTRKRWPNGIGALDFFEKQLASSAPGWLERGTVVHKSGSTTYPIIDTREGLAWLAQQASLEVHVPQWRFVGDGADASPGPATRIVFDLDPGDDVTFRQLCQVAHEVRGLITDIGLTTFPLTSGSKGLHLYVPLADPISSQGASVLAKRIAQQLEKTMPKQVTATMTKSLRAGKVFLDWSQNSAAKTTIAPYSMRGRDHPTVAAPRTWEEIEDPDLRHLRFDEVLERVARDGDLLAQLDESAPLADKLSTYRSMRDPGKTREPVPMKPPTVGNDDTFVIQEHHARRLHYDFRLERNGVLVSWAVPKNLPETTAVNHLAVHTEDHPLEYATFEGSIPKGEYGGGEVIVWDSGTYEAEKFNDHPPDGPEKGGEVIVTLHGSKVSGRYALIQTGGKNWLAHRMKEQPEMAPEDLKPMLATHGSVAKLTTAAWAFEGKWDGYRLLVDANHGELQLHSRSGRDVTHEYPQLKALAADLAEHHVILDGEVVALDESGVPNFGADAEPRPVDANRVLGLRHSAPRRSIPVARQVLRPAQATRGTGSGRRPDRAGPADRRRDRCPGVRAQAAVGGRRRQAAGLDLSTRPAVAVVDQGQALADAGGRHRRLACRRGWAHQRHRSAADRGPRERRAAVRGPGRNGLHGQGPRKSQEDARAAAHE